MEKNAKNFAIWTTLQSGKCIFFCDEPGFYGGVNKFDEKQYKSFCEKYGIKIDSYYEYKKETDHDIMKQILMIGVDYDQTEAFESKEVSIFTDTFHDAEEEDIVTGVLVLKDGQRISMFARDKIGDALFDKMNNFNKFFAL